MPDARSVGVGEALMDLIVAWCEQRRCVGIDAHALPGNRATKNFFETFGFKARLLTVHRPLRDFGEAGR
jgi:GNAT superfamily N-acetyltransferase